MSNTYLLPIWDTIGAAWEKVHGAKSIFWMAFATIILVMIFMTLTEGAADALAPGAGSVIAIFTQLLSFLFQMGILYMGIQRARDIPLKLSMIKRAFNFKIILKLIGTLVLQTLAFIIPILIFCLPIAGYKLYNEQLHSLAPASVISIGSAAIYVFAGLLVFFLFIRLHLAQLFVLDQEASPMQAIKLSYRATRSNVIRIFTTFIIMTLIVSVSALPLGIGLIWTFPMLCIYYGVVYKRLLANLNPV